MDRQWNDLYLGKGRSSNPTVIILYFSHIQFTQRNMWWCGPTSKLLVFAKLSKVPYEHRLRLRAPQFLLGYTSKKKKAIGCFDNPWIIQCSSSGFHEPIVPTANSQSADALSSKRGTPHHFHYHHRRLILHRTWSSHCSPTSVTFRIGITS